MSSSARDNQADRSGGPRRFPAPSAWGFDPHTFDLPPECTPYLAPLIGSLDRAGVLDDLGEPHTYGPEVWDTFTGLAHHLFGRRDSATCGHLGDVVIPKPIIAATSRFIHGEFVPRVLGMAPEALLPYVSRRGEYFALRDNLCVKGAWGYRRPLGEGFEADADRRGPYTARFSTSDGEWLMQESDMIPVLGVQLEGISYGPNEKHGYALLHRQEFFARYLEPGKAETFAEAVFILHSEVLAYACLLAADAYRQLERACPPAHRARVRVLGANWLARLRRLASGVGLPPAVFTKDHPDGHTATTLADYALGHLHRYAHPTTETDVLGGRDNEGMPAERGRSAAWRPAPVTDIAAEDIPNEEARGSREPTKLVRVEVPTGWRNVVVGGQESALIEVLGLLRTRWSQLDAKYRYVGGKAGRTSTRGVLAATVERLCTYKIIDLPANQTERAKFVSSVFGLGTYSQASYSSALSSRALQPTRREIENEVKRLAGL